jgi:hypothetical protein
MKLSCCKNWPIRDEKADILLQQSVSPCYMCHIYIPMCDALRVSWAPWRFIVHCRGPVQYLFVIYTIGCYETFCVPATAVQFPLHCLFLKSKLLKNRIVWMEATGLPRHGWHKKGYFKNAIFWETELCKRFWTGLGTIYIVCTLRWTPEIKFTT